MEGLYPQHNKDFYYQNQTMLQHLRYGIDELTRDADETYRHGYYLPGTDPQYPTSRPTYEASAGTDVQTEANIALTSLQNYMCQRYPRLASTHDAVFNLATMPAMIHMRKSVFENESGKYDLTHVTMASSHDGLLVEPSRFRVADVHLIRHGTPYGTSDSVSLLTLNGEEDISRVERWCFDNVLGFEYYDGVSTFPPLHVLGNLTDRLGDLPFQP